MKFLMIANSFGVNLQSYVNKIAEANNVDVDIYVLYIGGCSLDTHWRNIQEDAKAYELFHNGESTHEMISIKEALHMKNWELISLQQASHCSPLIDTYYPYFGLVYDFVKKESPQSEILFHKTWAYSPNNSFKYETVPSFFQPFNFAGRDEMKPAIDKCCNQIVKEYNIKRVIRSGDVVDLAVNALVDPYDSEGFHMNPIGCYLIGTNFVKMISDKPITKVYVPYGIGKATCEKLVEFINNNF